MFHNYPCCTTKLSSSRSHADLPSWALRFLMVLTISDRALSAARNDARIAAEVALDGLYIIRTSLSAAQMEVAQCVRSYKSLSHGEHAFRALKTVDLHVRVVHQRAFAMLQQIHMETKARTPLRRQLLHATTNILNNAGNSLANAGPLHVVAPTNAGFDKRSGGTVDTRLKPQDILQLKGILQHHVTTSALDLTDCSNGQMLSMVDGNSATITINVGATFINRAKLIGSVRASDGWVHVIDAVVVPKEE